MELKPHSFSNQTRLQRLEVSMKTQYDLIIIGGGITGAGIALDATLRGMKVLLVEKNDFASGTSSKSTKLIHGGLRYLKQLEFGLVRETGLERSVVHKNACHLVHPEDMLLPIVDGGNFNQFSASLAISVYDRLAQVNKNQRRKKLSKKKVQQLEPLLRTELLKSGVLYSEYRTDDARLTIEIIKAAHRNGAEIFNYLEVKNFTYSKGKLSGVICFDHITEKKVSLVGKQTVSSTGPWVDTLRKQDKPNTHSNLHLSKGVHIVIDKEKLNITNSIYFDAFDGRMLFAIPRDKMVYVGTTDTSFTGDKNNLFCDYKDANYLLKGVNAMFNTELSLADIKSSWTGLRPLIKKSGKGSSELSRRDEVFISESGLISIAGGKLTGYRKMAKRVVDLVSDKLVQPFGKCQTKNYKIHHKPFDNYSEFQKTIANYSKSVSFLTPEEIHYLFRTYGKDATFIIEDAVQNDMDLVTSQIQYALDHESIYHPLDFIERRSGWLFFDIDKALQHHQKVIDVLAQYLSKDEIWVNDKRMEVTNQINVHSLSKLKSK